METMTTKLSLILLLLLTPVANGDVVVRAAEIIDPSLVSPDGDIYKSSQEDMIVNLGEKNFYGFGFDKP
jgi:hypothetical protein